jgi:hypothetical protein
MVDKEMKILFSPLTLMVIAITVIVQGLEIIKTVMLYAKKGKNVKGT